MPALYTCPYQFQLAVIPSVLPGQSPHLQINAGIGEVLKGSKIHREQTLIKTKAYLAKIFHLLNLYMNGDKTKSV